MIRTVYKGVRDYIIVDAGISVSAGWAHVLFITLTT